MPENINLIRMSDGKLESYYPCNERQYAYANDRDEDGYPRYHMVCDEESLLLDQLPSDSESLILSLYVKNGALQPGDRAWVQSDPNALFFGIKDRAKQAYGDIVSDEGWAILDERKRRLSELVNGDPNPLAFLLRELCIRSDTGDPRFETESDKYFRVSVNEFWLKNLAERGCLRLRHFEGNVCANVMDIVECLTKDWGFMLLACDFFYQQAYKKIIKEGWYPGKEVEAQPMVTKQDLEGVRKATENLIAVTDLARMSVIANWQVLDQEDPKAVKTFFDTCETQRQKILEAHRKVNQTDQLIAIVRRGRKYATLPKTHATYERMRILTFRPPNIKTNCDNYKTCYEYALAYTQKIHDYIPISSASLERIPEFLELMTLDWQSHPDYKNGRIDTFWTTEVQDEIEDEIERAIECLREETTVGNGVEAQRVKGAGGGDGSANVAVSVGNKIKRTIAEQLGVKAWHELEVEYLDDDKGLRWFRKGSFRNRKCTWEMMGLNRSKKMKGVLEAFMRYPDCIPRPKYKGKDAEKRVREEAAYRSLVKGLNERLCNAIGLSGNPIKNEGGTKCAFKVSSPRQENTRNDESIQMDDIEFERRVDEQSLEEWKYKKRIDERVQKNDTK